MRVALGDTEVLEDLVIKLKKIYGCINKEKAMLELRC